MINSVISYNGKVTIRVKNKPPKSKHNEGTSHLFNLLHSILTQALILDDMKQLSQKLPSYFVLVKDNPTISSDVLLEGNYSDIENRSVLLQALPIVNRELTKTEKGEGLKFSALLTHSMLNTSTYELTDGYILMLDSHQNNILAFSKIDLRSIQPVYDDVAGQAAIDWEMSFNNSLEEV